MMSLVFLLYILPAAFCSFYYALALVAKKELNGGRFACICQGTERSSFYEIAGNYYEYWDYSTHHNNTIELSRAPFIAFLVLY